jgi:RsiW-degrading membrane proteinase PrsW (M82 family)
MNEQWYYLQGSTPTGPVDTAALTHLIQTNQLAPAVLVARLGSPNWLSASEAFHMASPALPHVGVIGSARSGIEKIAGTKKLQGFSLSEMFSEVFKHRTAEELDDYFIVGTYRTTPRLQDVPTGWPKPWFFWRVLTLFGSAYLAILFAYVQFGTSTLIPGLEMFGALVIPLTLVFLFFELNVPRNVSFPQVLMLMCSGGVLSVGLSLVGYQFSNLGWLGASAAGIIEEIGKIAAVYLVLRKKQYNYILNGLLLGAAVGAGFAAIESAGYIYTARDGNSAADFVNITTLRAVGNLFNHIVWTAIASAALLRAKGTQILKPGILLNSSFLAAFSIPVGLHMLWNSPIPDFFNLKTLILGVVGWYVVFGFVQQGLAQVDSCKRDLERVS